MADSIAQLASSINSLSFKLECFDGSPNYLPEKFVKDFKQFLIATGRVSKPFIIDKATKRLIPNPEKGILEKQILRTYLKGEAKSWFNLLPDETPYETVLTELIERFKLTKQQKHLKRVDLFRAKQRIGEKYSDFVTRVCLMNIGLDLSQDELVSILIGGAESSIQPLLMIKEPKNVKELMQIPFVRDICGNSDQEFVGMVDTKSTTEMPYTQKHSELPNTWWSDAKTFHDRNQRRRVQRQNENDFNDPQRQYENNIYDPQQNDRNYDQQHTIQPRGQYNSNWGEHFEEENHYFDENFDEGRCGNYYEQTKAFDQSRRMKHRNSRRQ